MKLKPSSDDGDMGGMFQAAAGFPESDISESKKTKTKIKVLRCILSVISHLSGFRLQAGPTHAVSIQPPALTGISVTFGSEARNLIVSILQRQAGYSNTFFPPFISI